MREAEVTRLKEDKDDEVGVLQKPLSERDAAKSEMHERCSIISDECSSLLIAHPMVSPACFQLLVGPLQQRVAAVASMHLAF